MIQEKRGWGEVTDELSPLVLNNEIKLVKPMIQ